MCHARVGSSVPSGSTLTVLSVSVPLVANDSRLWPSSRVHGTAPALLDRVKRPRLCSFTVSSSTYAPFTLPISRRSWSNGISTPMAASASMALGACMPLGASVTSYSVDPEATNSWLPSSAGATTVRSTRPGWTTAPCRRAGHGRAEQTLGGDQHQRAMVSRRQQGRHLARRRAAADMTGVPSTGDALCGLLTLIRLPWLVANHRTPSMTTGVASTLPLTDTVLAQPSATGDTAGS